MPVFAMRLTPEILDAVTSVFGLDATPLANDTPYVVMQVVGPTEFNLKFVTEDEMVDAYANDSTLQLLN